MAGYPQHKHDTPADTVGEVTKGEFPLLMQWDMRWGYANYGDGLMALNGCGPTALSMVICGLTGDDTITPYTVAQYADSQGLYVDGVGTSWDLMRTGAEHFGLTAKELPLDEGVVTRALKMASPSFAASAPATSPPAATLSCWWGWRTARSGSTIPTATPPVLSCGTMTPWPNRSTICGPTPWPDPSLPEQNGV